MCCGQQKFIKLVVLQVQKTASGDHLAALEHGRRHHRARRRGTLARKDSCNNGINPSWGQSSHNPEVMYWDYVLGLCFQCTNSGLTFKLPSGWLLPCLGTCWVPHGEAAAVAGWGAYIYLYIYMYIYANTYMHAVITGGKNPWIWKRTGNGVWENLEEEKGWNDVIIL